jgi:hypothetical protein
MNGNASILFDPHTACLTEQAMFSYLDGKLTPMQCHQVEKHLLDCAFCSEAMEGLELVKDRSKVSGASNLTSENPDTKESPGNGRIIRFNFNTRLAAAAVIVLLLGSFALLRYWGADKALHEVAENAGEKKLRLKKDSTSEPATITSEDQTFYKHFEPFPAETPKPPARNDEMKGEQTYTRIGKEQSMHESYETDALKTEPPPPPSDSPEVVVSAYGTSATAQPNQSGASGDAVTSPPPSAASPVVVYKTTAPQEKSELPSKKQNSPSLVPTNATVKTEEKDKTGDRNEGYTDFDESKKPAPAKAKEKTVIQKDSEEKPASGKDIASGESKERKMDQLEQNTSPSGGPVYSGANKQATINTKNTKMLADSTTATLTLSNSSTSAADKPDQTSYAFSRTQTLKDAEKSVYRRTPMDDAMDAYRDNDFKSAADQFGKIIATEPNNINALFYEGVCFLSLQIPDTKHAIADFDKVLLSQNTSFAEAAKWYKALALIKDNNTAEAKPMLDEMSKGKGAYKVKAVKVLKDIEEPKK